MADDLSIPNPSYRRNRARPSGRPAVRRPPRMDPDTKRLLLFAAAVGGVLVVLIGASVLGAHRGGPTPVVLADPGPIRVRPVNPGGMKIDAAENDVFSGRSDMADARLAPAAEAPDPTALRAVEAAPVRPAPAPVRTAPPPAARQAIADNVALPPVPPRRHATEVAAVTPPRRVVEAPRVEAHPAEARLAGSKPTIDHAIIVQLAAMASDAEAKAEWERLRRKFGGLLDGRQLIISRVAFDGHTFWRVRTGGFADAAQAHAFCDRLHAKGSGCSVDAS